MLRFKQPTRPPLEDPVPEWPRSPMSFSGKGAHFHRAFCLVRLLPFCFQHVGGSYIRMKKQQRRSRSPRFVVPNNEQAVVSVGAEKLKGTLDMLSLTGGTVRLDKRFASGTFADIGIQTASGTFSAAIELLPMARNNAQAFRFIAMGPVARGRLNDGLSKMRAQGLAVEKTPLDHFRSLARRVLSVRSAK
jgi:hypothetical protein